MGACRAVCVRACVCVRASVCVRVRLYVCACVCVCALVRIGETHRVQEKFYAFELVGHRCPLVAPSTMQHVQTRECVRVSE
jgi:hypothetical protein